MKEENILKDFSMEKIVWYRPIKSHGANEKRSTTAANMKE